MKTWRWLAALLVLALLAAYIFLGTGYLKQNNHSKAQLSELSSLRAVLVMLPEIPTDLNDRLAAARAVLATAENAFASETDGTTIIDTVLRLADEAGVKGVPLSSQPWTEEQISNRIVSVFRLSVEVTGNFQQIHHYLELLDSSSLKTMAVKYIKVVRASVKPDALMTASLDIAVYTLTPTAE
jgi:hypothetical protein